MMGEAHGLVTDMLADPSLPAHTGATLRAVSKLLSAQLAFQPLHHRAAAARLAPLLHLGEQACCSDGEEASPPDRGGFIHRVRRSWRSLIGPNM